MATEQDKNPYFTIRLEPDLREALAKLAKENDRSVSAEIRQAIRAHLEAAAA